MNVAGFKAVTFWALAFSCLVSCKDRVDIEYVRSKVWEHESGFRIGEGDFVVFRNNENLFQLRRDTIYYSDTPKALVKWLDKKRFNLTVVSIDGKESGVYRNQEESLESQ